MIANPATASLVDLEGRLAALTSQRDRLHARVAVLDVGIAEVRELVGEIDTRLKGQEGEVARSMLAAGQTVSFGSNHTQQIVRWTDANGTQQLSGPSPLESAEGQADHARRVYDALVLEAEPIRASLAGMERERHDARRTAGLLGGEIGGVEGQIARIRAEESARVELIGRVDWRDRLAAILTRLMHGTPPRTVQELAAEGKSVREIAEATGISKSSVQRALSGGVPGGTADLQEGA
jgi:hypothetical protein